MNSGPGPGNSDLSIKDEDPDEAADAMVMHAVCLAH